RGTACRRDRTARRAESRARRSADRREPGVVDEHVLRVAQHGQPDARRPERGARIAAECDADQGAWAVGAGGDAERRGAAEPRVALDDVDAAGAAIEYLGYEWPAQTEQAGQPPSQLDQLRRIDRAAEIRLTGDHHAARSRHDRQHLAGEIREAIEA